MGLELESMAIEMPEVASHPNRVSFRGVLTFVDVASDAAPSGARGHRVMLKKSATEKAIPSLLGMALDYAPSLDRHDARRKVGVITQADMVTGQKKPMGVRQTAGAAHRLTDEDVRPHIGLWRLVDICMREISRSWCGKSGPRVRRCWGCRTKLRKRRSTICRQTFGRSAISRLRARRYCDETRRRIGRRG